MLPQASEQAVLPLLYVPHCGIEASGDVVTECPFLPPIYLVGIFRGSA